MLLAHQGVPMTRLTAAGSILLVGVLIVAGDAQVQRRGIMARADSTQGPQVGMMGPNMMAMMQGMQDPMMARMPMRDVMQMVQSTRGNSPMQEGWMMRRGTGPGPGMGMSRSNPQN